MSGNNIALNVVSLLFKIFFIVIILVVLLQYVALDIMAQKIISRAEVDGYLDYSVYQTYLSQLTFDTLNVEVIEVSPNWGVMVNKLGDPLRLVMVNKYKVKVFGQELKFWVRVSNEGINQGYYGKGY